MWNLCRCYLGLLLLLFSAWMPCNVSSQRPSVVNVGALVAFDSTIGRVAKSAMELAVTSVNSDSTLLAGTQLELTMMDTNCSSFKGTVAAVELLKKNVVAVLGPQLSVLAHTVSHMANELQIPVVSFAATDPTLISSEYPYFIRMAHNDYSQMSTIAAVVGYYGWTEVVAVHEDDDYGRNGVSVLGDALGKVGAKITSRAPIPHGCSQLEMGNIVAKLALVEERVFVVHMNSDAGLDLFAGAQHLGLLSDGYVWMATDWLSSVLDSNIVSTDVMKSLQGVIGLRRHIPESENHKSFTQQWTSLQAAHEVDASLNVFALYAYDTIFMIAHSIDSFLNQGGNFSFVEQNTQSKLGGSNSELEALQMLEGGAELRQIILQTNFTGVAGPVQIDENRDLIGSAFEIINIAGTGFRTIGYWSPDIGISATPPENPSPINSNISNRKLKLPNVIWPGESTDVPRGWAISTHGKDLVIGVPRKVGFTEFVTVANDSQIPSGYCVDVFLAAVYMLPYTISYEFAFFGTGEFTPKYDDLVNEVVSKNFDAAVGDITILKKRSKIVDFTQPYEESGLVVVAPYKQTDSDAWAFLRPFTVGMWSTTVAFFVFIGIVVWVLEHRSNPQFRGHPKDQVMNVLWFAFSTMFFAHRENAVSSLGRVVLILWLFVVLIINSSYTASLTSILTVQQLEPTIHGMDSLALSNLPIGYQSGSFIANYLMDEYKIPKYRLVPLNTEDDFDNALTLGPKKGGVAAIVDERPYMESFLSTNCQYKIVDTEFSKGGWGFAFPKDSKLAVDMSTAILRLSENGELQRIHDKWLKSGICREDSLTPDSNQFGLDNFWGLFLVIGIVCFLALLIFFLKMIWQFTHYSHMSLEDSPAKSHSFTEKSAKVLKSFASFVHERDESDKIGKLKRERSDKEMDPQSEKDSRPV